MAINEFPRSHGSLSGLTGTDHHTQYVSLTSGTLATRPGGPYREGRLYRTTDTAQFFYDNGAGWLELSTKVADDAAYIAKAGGSTVQPLAATTKGLVIQGAASQSANLTEWQNSAGTVLASVNGFDGRIVAPQINLAGTEAAFGNTGGAINLMAPSATRQGLIVRGVASQSANLQEWQSSAGTVLASINTNGTASLDQGGSATSTFGALANLGSTNARVAIDTFAAGAKGLVVRGVVSQSASLQEWQNSAGTVVSKIAADGSLLLSNSGAAQPLNGNGNGPMVGMQPYIASQTPLIVKGIASQTGNLTEWQSSAGTAIAYISSGGNVASTGTVTVLSDASVKENVTPVVGALDTIRSLRPVSFDYIDGSTGQRGFIAQQVAEVIPNAVTDFGSDGLLGLREGAILSTLVAAVQELSTMLMRESND